MTVAFFENLTWSCHVCGKERPDRLIGVYSTRWDSASGFEIRQNVRHCVDNAACVEGAKLVSFVDSERLRPLGYVEVLDEPVGLGGPMVEAEKRGSASS